MPINLSPSPATKSVEEHKRLMTEKYSTPTMPTNKRPRESNSHSAFNPESAHRDSMLAESQQTVRKTHSDLETLTNKFNEIESAVAYNNNDIAKLHSENAMLKEDNSRMKSRVPQIEDDLASLKTFVKRHTARRKRKQQQKIHP